MTDREALEKIAFELRGILTNSLKKSERKIAKILKEVGVVVNPTDEDESK